jgi:hypothetical protein
MVSRLLVIKDYNKRNFLNKHFDSKIYLKSNLQNFFLKKKNFLLFSSFRIFI